MKLFRSKQKQKKMTVEEAVANNTRIFFERGPGLHMDYVTHIVAKDTPNGKILLGGLGAMGVGMMWVEDDGRFSSYPGYAEASEVRGEDPHE